MQDSPTSKLLYNKEVQEYKVKVRQYYQSVARLPRIPEDVMQSYLKQLSEVFLFLSLYLSLSLSLSLVFEKYHSFSSRLPPAPVTGLQEDWGICGGECSL